jgi:hypothetical protein
MRLRYVLFFWLIQGCLVFAGSGETGFSFLKIGIGGRAAGMGEAATVLSTDAAATYWNPAGLAVDEHNNALFTYNHWIENVQHNFFAVKFIHGANAFGLHYIATGVDGIEQREIPSATPTAYFSSHEIELGISYARKINARWALGMTANYIYERIQNSVSAIGFDVGVWHTADYLSKDHPLKLGFVLSNVGFSGKLINEKVRLPTTIRFGSAYDIFWDSDSRNIWTAAVDIIKPVKDKLRIHVGTEFGYKDFLFLRAGYQFGYDARGMTAGLGMKIVKTIRVDYGYMPFSNALGVTHRIGASFDF